jgi:hypothetical protein
VAFFHAFFSSHSKPFLARAKKMSGKKWFDFNEHEVLFFHENEWKKSKMREKKTLFTHFTFFHAFYNIYLSVKNKVAFFHAFFSSD